MTEIFSTNIPQNNSTEIFGINISIQIYYVYWLVHRSVSKLKYTVNDY